MKTAKSFQLGRWASKTVWNTKSPKSYSRNKYKKNMKDDPACNIKKLLNTICRQTSRYKETKAKLSWKFTQICIKGHSQTCERSIGKSVRDKKMEIGFIEDGGTENNKSRLMYNIHMKLFFLLAGRSSERA